MKEVIKIEGMSCGHCVKAVESALNALVGVTSASVSLEKKEAVVEFDDSLSLDVIRRAIEDEGYEVV